MNTAERKPVYLHGKWLLGNGSWSMEIYGICKSNQQTGHLPFAEKLWEENSGGVHRLISQVAKESLLPPFYWEGMGSFPDDHLFQTIK